MESITIEVTVKIREGDVFAGKHIAGGSFSSTREVAGDPKTVADWLMVLVEEHYAQIKNEITPLLEGSQRRRLDDEKEQRSDSVAE